MEPAGEQTAQSERGRFEVLNINQTSGTVVAGETQALATAIDSAMLAQARLCASIIETANESKLPVVTTQKLLQSLTANMNGLVTSRAEFATAVRELNVIQARSNLREMATGCPNGLAPMKGSMDDEPRCQIAPSAQI
jgi:hypothetical protein